MVVGCDIRTHHCPVRPFLLVQLQERERLVSDFISSENKPRQRRHMVRCRHQIVQDSIYKQQSYSLSKKTAKLFTASWVHACFKMVKAKSHSCDLDNSITRIFISPNSASPSLFSKSGRHRRDSGGGRPARQWAWRRVASGPSGVGGGHVRSGRGCRSRSHRS
jgi:hypothetical protein